MFVSTILTQETGTFYRERKRNVFFRNFFFFITNKVTLIRRNDKEKIAKRREQILLKFNNSNNIYNLNHMFSLPGFIKSHESLLNN